MALSAAASVQAAPAEIGFPAYAFAGTWTSLPIDHFGSVSPTSAPVKTHVGRALPIEAPKVDRLLGEAFATSGDDAMRRELALNALMSPWPQEQRTAFQKLRDAKTAYAGDDRHAQHFASLVTRVVDGTGRSAAVDGSASGALDTAYAAALSREDDGLRAKTEAAHKAFLAYRDAFAAFADGQSLGTGMSVAAELDRERTADLSADKH